MSIIILGIVLLVRLADESQLIFTFPLDYINDLSAYMAQLHFLKVCGYLAFCPYWYNGFVHLSVSPPGWYFFAYPFLLLSNNVLIATYGSMILLFALALAASLFLAKRSGLSRLNGVAFFCFVFANAINIGDFIRLGRLHAFLVLVLATVFMALVLPYRTRNVDLNFLWAGLVYGLMIITHNQETVLFSLMFVSVILTRNSWKELGIILMAGGVALLAASWWIVPLLRTLMTEKSSLLAPWNFEGERLLNFSPELGLTNLVGISIGIAVLALGWILWKQKIWTKHDCLFFSPILVFAALFLARLPAFLPVLKQISPDPYAVFFLMFAAFFLLQWMESRFINIKNAQLLAAGLVSLALVSGMTTLFITPWFAQHTSLDKEVISLFSDLQGRFLILGPINKTFDKSYAKADYAFAAVYYNASTSEGWSQPLASSDYLLRLTGFKRNFSNFSCAEFTDEVRFFNTTDLISYDDTCPFLAKCGLSLVKKTAHTCLYRI